MNKELEYATLFLTYICVADENIHQNEIDVIKNFITDNNIALNIENDIMKILMDKTDKLPLNEIITQLGNIESQFIKDIITVSLVLSASDGHIDQREEDIILKLVKKSNVEQKEYDEKKYEVLYHLRINKNIKVSNKLINRLLVFLRHSTNGSLRFKIDKKIKNFLFNDKVYKKAIYKCRLKAREDFDFVKNKILPVRHIYNECIISIDALTRKMKEYENSNIKEESDIFESISKIQKEIKNNVNELEKEINTSMMNKERSLDKFTISLLGRTKAGKSTLMSIISGEGENFIGIGKQRTSRFNRVIDWNNIRIIDTPGIGAPGGKKDEDIARSIIDESDLICYLCNTDSEQESELDFIRYLIDQKKPLIIVLNYKSTEITDETRIKYFLNSPESWLNNKTERSLQGHIRRIERAIETKTVNGSVKIIPIYLLAALLSTKDEYSKYSQTFHKSSHIDDFINEIRNQIINIGELRKSQAIIRGTINLLENQRNKLKLNNSSLIVYFNAVKENTPKLYNRIDSAFKKTQIEIINTITLLFIELKNNTTEFARGHYKIKPKEINKRYEVYIDEKNFKDKFNNEINTTINNYYGKEIEEAINIFSDNIEMSMKSFYLNMNKYEKGNSINTKGIVNVSLSSIGLVITVGVLLKSVAGMPATIAAICTFFTPPVVIAATIILLATSVITNSFMKSKKEKITNLQNKLKDSINDSIEQNIPKIKNDIIKNFEEHHNKVIKSLKYTTEIKNDIIEKIIRTNSRVINDLDTIVIELYRKYCLRIIAFATKKENIKENNFQFTVNENSLEIKTDIGINANINIAKILQDNVTFLTNKEI